MNNDGLLEIAKAINNLVAVIGSINFTLWMFLLFKNMGTSSTLFNKLIDKIDELLIKNQ
jgi:hypothetical protein